MDKQEFKTFAILLAVGFVGLYLWKQKLDAAALAAGSSAGAGVAMGVRG